MRKLNWKKYIITTGNVFAYAVVFGAALLQAPSAYAESKPIDVTPPPIPPNPELCWQILSGPQGPATAGESKVATFMQCLNDYSTALSTYHVAASNYWYRRQEQISQTTEFQIKLAAMGALLDSLAYITTNFAYDTANMILGVDRPDGKPSFYEEPFGDYLAYHADQAAGVFFERFDSMYQFSADFGSGEDTTFGFTTLCEKPSPLDIRLGLGLGDMGPLQGATCTLSAMVENFEAIRDMVNSGDALNIHRASFEPYGNDLHVGLEIQSNYVDAILSDQTQAKLARQESEGMVPIIDKITQRIQWPSLMANEGMRNLEPTGMAMVQQDKQEAYMVQAFWETGLEGLGFLTLSTFLNRLAFGFLEKILTPDVSMQGSGVNIDPTKYNITYQSLINENAAGDAQNYFERQAFAKSLGDFIVPNYFTSEDKDLTTDLSTCPPMRNKWNCAMDQQLAVAINLGVTNGALTIGKASGIGNENSGYSTNNQGLHADWELIPESDIVNNSDPSCYQRAYCAGNLKKMRLARILPVGFEMAANSPYNVKRAGKYATLGEVIRGFYDCNDKGELDKDHPWCHLINPNWILVAPKYLCRTKGYGDTLMPELGTRQEECGDVVSCLGTNQKGECTDGYGYCLAERSAYKFDAPECSEQYASCRTYQSSKGETHSALRYTVERGACSAENIGCMWFATNRYVTSSASPDGLWEGTLTEGSRVYLDGAVEPCSSEGCTKVFNVKPGETAFNLINNSSFEKVTEVEQSGTLVLQGIDAWDLQSAVLQNIDTTKESYDGTRGISIDSSVGDEIIQIIRIQPNRNYTFSYYSKNPGNISNGNIDLQFGNIDNTTGIFTNSQGTEADIAFFEDCVHTGGNVLRLRAVDYDITPNEWQRNVCQFVSPLNSTYVEIKMAAGGANGLTFDALSLEEGEYATDYVEELAELPESHIKIAPDEYQCTGNDNEDHPACKNFARACYQTEIGCQGYTDVNDPTAPEIPATLTAKDYCPDVCSGYGEYRKLASAFDLVYNPVYLEYSDPSDNGKAYLIPSASQSCTLQNVGCEPFTSLEAASQGGEQVAYYDDLRTCQKPNDLSRTYFTWEGSDAEGYVLRTWALVASSTANNSPKVVLKGAMFGDIKDPDACNEDLWGAGIDQDCRQFYDETGAVYYAYYSQTVSSDSACTLYRKDDSSEVDCTKTGGHEFVPQSGSCLYYALPSESTTCPATAGGCRAYLGPTGRNAVQTYYQTFMEDASASGFASGLNSAIARSEESVLVGDYSLRVDSVGGSNIEFHTDIPLITTTTLYRVSFWAKSLGTGDASVTIDGQTIGSFKPTTIWQRFEFGPFEVEDSTSTFAIAAPQALGSVFIDTIKLDQLNDVRFLIKNSWTIPAACDATAEGTPEPRVMLGCSEYIDRDGNQIFARNFSNLCRADSIGCKAFIDTRSVNNPYPETRTITGTPGPSQRNDADARTYEEQYLGEWSVSSGAWRYYYAIDDSRARCDESQASCRAFGKPHFTQDRLSLKATEYSVDPADTELLQTQDIIYEFETVLLKHNWEAYYNDDGSLNLACRKDELHCDRFQSGNVTEFFRNPGDHTCEWRDAKQLEANPGIGIYTAGTYGGWFRKGTDTPCYPGDDTETPPKAPYLKNGDNFGAYFTGEDQYAGWVSNCPVDQSECTEFVDPNDASDQTRPYGRSYFLINSNKLDTRSCANQADPLAGCVLFNNKSVNTLQANSKATYQKSVDERGSPQEPVDCDNDPENPYCKVCINFTFGDTPQGFVGTDPAEILSSLIYNQSNSLTHVNQLLEYEKQLQSEGFTCNTDQDCLALGSGIFPDGQAPNANMGYVAGTCGRKNDSNVIVKVKLDRECARWMGCSTAETIYDSVQQKYVNKCNELELCEKNGSRNEDIFCAQFTDRSQESLLREGQFIDLQSYSARTIEYGSLDYSGYTIPNQYLVTDITSRYVGKDLMTDLNLQDRYSLDKRLVAEISLDNQYIEEYEDAGSGTGSVCRDFELVECAGYGCNAYYDDIKSSIGKACNTDGDCYIYEHDMQYTAQGNCGLSLCRDTRSGLIGYQDLIKNTCVLAVGSPSAMSLVASGQTGGDLSRNADSIYDNYIQENITVNNASLQSAMPAPECQLYPEAGSPLPNEYVESWKNGTNPPVPEKMISGYEGARACVYGENCSCSYRKVRYANGIEQYYSMDGKAPSVGICSGGELDGQACVPGGYVPVDSQNKVLVSTQQADMLQKNQTCPGGVCSAIQDVVIQNGQYGYCLERDKTRAGTANQLNAPCLTWSPQVVIGGKYDLTHYSPTAGYLPPQGSGEYYCTSGANQQRLESPSTFTRFTGKYWESSAFIAPGYMQQFAYALPNVWDNTSDNNYSVSADIDGNNNKSNNYNIDTIKKEEDTDVLLGKNNVQNMGFACRRVSLCAGYDVKSNIGDKQYSPVEMETEYDGNASEGRWIMTGSGPNKSYLEYFIPYTPGLFGIDDKYFDYRFGLFRFSLKPYNAGAACKWNPAWIGQNFPSVDGTKDFSCESYLQQIQDLSNQIYQNINQNFSGILDRSSEDVLVDDQNVPIKLQCTNDSNNSCYYKFWETGYQDDEQQKFIWINTRMKDNTESFEITRASQAYFARECSSKNPYFSIRAMFQNTNKIENALPVEEARSVKLSGPWQFVGFWITSCVPTNQTENPAYLYMNMDFVKADVCNEVAQVISPETRENAAFTDRVWSQGNFILPTVGVSYETRNEPFASALAADKIGKDPMLMGVSVPISGDYSKAPSFVDSGVSIQSLFNEQNAWVPLSNLFAKIYKVYRWSPYLVTKDDWACIKGASMGSLCPPNQNTYWGLVHCGDFATCSDELDVDLINQDWRCNSLSGVNRGLGCGQFSLPERNTDPICHNAATFINEEDQPEELYASCNPTDPTKPSRMSFKFDITLYNKDYNPLTPTVYPDLTFQAVECDNGGQFYANPINPGIAQKRWDSPEVLIFGLLKVALKYNTSGDEQDVCQSGSNGRLDDLLVRTLQIPNLKNALYNELNSTSGLVNWSGFNDDDVYKETVLDYAGHWYQLPVNYSLGTWDPWRTTYLMDYSCSADAVNAGHRCKPGSNDEFGKSIHCPKRIDACNSGITNADTNGDGKPDCGLCVKVDDEYKELYKVDGVETGHCQYFNEFSRCTTNNDCVFTEFEYWGSYDADDGVPEGENWDDLEGMLPLIHEEDQVLDLNAPDLARVRLPRPLFPASEYASEEKINGKTPYAVPGKYSEPAIITNFGGQLNVQRNSINPSSLLFTALGPSPDSCKIGSMKLICDDLESGIKASIKSVDEDGIVDDVFGNWADVYNDPTAWESWVGVVFDPAGILGKIGSFLGVFGNTSGEHQKEKIAEATGQLIRTIANCRMECAAGGFIAPSGYAAHFEEITASTAGTDNRSVTVAPFVVDPFYKTVRSMGYQVNKTTGYCEDSGDLPSEDKDCCDQEHDFRGDFGRAYFLQGSYIYEHHDWGPARYGDCGGDDWTWDATGGPSSPTDKGVDIFKPNTDLMESDMIGSVYERLAKKFWPQLGFDHRFNNATKSSLLNEDLPWDPDKNIYFTKLFPLITKQYSYINLQPVKIKVKGFSQALLYFYPINSVWTGFGVSESLLSKLQDYLSTIEARFTLDQDLQDLEQQRNSILSNVLLTPQQKEDSLADIDSQITVKNGSLEELLAVENDYYEAYQKDFKDNYANQTGWATQLSPDDKRLKLFPGAVEVAKSKDNNNSAPLFLTGHCEPPKNGTDSDTIKGSIKGVPTANKSTVKEGMPYIVNVYYNNAYSGLPDWVSWYDGDVDIDSWFINAWHPFDGYYDYTDQSTYGGVNKDDNYFNKSDTNGYRPEITEQFVQDALWIGASVAVKEQGNDISIEGPFGDVVGDRTTCRCEGGKFDGQPKSNAKMCNKGLADEENPENFDPAASPIDDPSDYCKPVSLANGTPQSYCQAETGISGHPDPDLDDNWCTHRPGYMPRGDVCADGRDNCLTTYDLTSYTSTNHISVTNMSPKPKTAPSATDVTNGLDTYKYITGTYDPYVEGRDHLNNKNFTVYYRPRPPRIAAPDPSRQSSSANTLPVSSMDTFSVNGLANGLAYHGGGQGLSTIRFYAWAMHDQGPIKEVIIDWGDGTHQIIDNAQLKNHKPVCNATRECEFIEGYACTSDADCPPAAGACLEKGTCKQKVYLNCDSDDDCGNGDECETRMFFGNSTEACQQGYFEFSHVYQCNPQSVLDLVNNDKICDRTGLCENEPGLTCSAASDCRPGEECIFNQLAEPDGCYNEQLSRCRFTPRIMVIDNWGWCTGDCSRENEVKPGDTENLSKSDLIRHPYGGCWNGSATKINSEVSYEDTQDPYFGSTMPNECKPYFEEENYFTRDAFKLYRPWIVFDGSVEVSQPNYIELKSDGFGGFNLLYMYQINYSNNPILFNTL